MAIGVNINVSNINDTVNSFFIILSIIVFGCKVRNFRDALKINEVYFFNFAIIVTCCILGSYLFITKYQVYFSNF